MSDPRTPSQSPSPVTGTTSPSPLPILPSLEFTLRVLGDQPLAEPVSLKLTSLGSSLTNPLDRPLFPEFRQFSPSLPGSGESMLRWRGPERSGYQELPFGVRPFRTYVVPLDVTQLILEGLGKSVDEITVKVWINLPPPQGKPPPVLAPPEPPYTPVKDPDTRKNLIDTVNKAATQANKKKVESNSEVHIQIQVFAGVQAVAHRKLLPNDPKTATSEEVQAIQGANLTVQFHRDDDSGAEIQVQVQFAKDLLFHDPSQTGDAATQKPSSVQGSVGVNYVQVVSKTLSVVYGVQGFVGRSTQFDDTHQKGTIQFGAAGGVGVQYKANDWLTLGASGQSGVTFGPGAGRDWRKVNWGDDTTIDFSAMATAAVDTEKLVDALVKAFKK